MMMIHLFLVRRVAFVLAGTCLFVTGLVGCAADAPDEESTDHNQTPPSDTHQRSDESTPDIKVDTDQSTTPTLFCYYGTCCQYLEHKYNEPASYCWSR